MMKIKKTECLNCHQTFMYKFTLIKRYNYFKRQQVIIDVCPHCHLSQKSMKRVR